MRLFFIFWTICFSLTVSVIAQTTDSNPLRFLHSIPPSPDNPQKSILDIGIKDEKAVTYLAYNLAYNDIKLPPRVNCGTDWWGFYNGANNNHTLMSNDVECPYYLGNNIYQFNTGSIIQIPTPDVANRDSNADSPKAGMLTKITYPTGGWAAFEFEVNQYATTVAKQ